MFVGIVLFLQTMCCEFHKLFIIKFAFYVCMFLCNEIKKDVKHVLVVTVYLLIGNKESVCGVLQRMRAMLT